MFRVDAVLELDTVPAAAADDLAQTVNYAELAKQLYAVLAGEPVALLETLAQRLADVCLTHALVDAVEITVHKPQAELGVPFDDVTAITALKDDGLVARSTLYETPPWGPVEQQPYLNAVVVVRGPRDARGWLARAAELEQAAGRTREVRFGPRTLDVDVIVVSGDDGTPVLSDDPELTLPHPRAHERAFVLVPWVTLDPGAVLPGHGRVADLVAALTPDDVAAVVRWDHVH
jgi:2-amino-4-hydroxy-6-hydroxymethyldihydropteridine diphosphokinase